MKTSFPYLIVVLSGFLAPTATAQNITVYTNETAFDQALASSTTDTFDGLTIGSNGYSGEGTHFTDLGNSYNYSGGDQEYLGSDSGPFAPGDGSQFAVAVTQIVPASGSNAFGVDTYAFVTDGYAITVTDSLGNHVLAAQQHSPGLNGKPSSAGFVGFIDQNPGATITNVSLTNTDIIDNVTTGTALTGTPKTVYLDIRTDGQTGSGTSTDPYDASTETEFDSLMNSFGQATTIYLGPGTYLTNGPDAFVIKAGWTINGAGMGKTIVKLNGHVGSGQKHVNLSTNTSIDTDNVQIRDFTIDGNDQGYSWPAHDAVGGLDLQGNHLLAERIEAINCYGDYNAPPPAQLQEQFSIYLGGAPAMATDIVIRDCLTHQYAPGANFTNGALIFGCDGGQITNCFDDGSNHAFGFSGTQGSVISGCRTTSRTSVGYYIDTGSAENVTIENNILASAATPIQFASSGPYTNINILNNVLESSGSPGSGGAAIVLGGSPGEVFKINGNTFIYTGSGESGLVNNDGNYTSLDIENNTSNVGLPGAGCAPEELEDSSDTVQNNNLEVSLSEVVEAQFNTSFLTPLSP